MNVLGELLIGFALNLIVAFILIVFIYYPRNRGKSEYVFTFFTFNILIYFVSGLLRDVQLSVGFGFGLLAVFSTIRYRTERVPIKEMTYLFISMSLPFINTLFQATRITMPELIVIDFILLLAFFILEHQWGVYYAARKKIRYEKIELIKPENREQLLEDLRQRTGLNIKHCEVEDIDLLRDTAQLLVYYDEDNSTHD